MDLNEINTYADELLDQLKATSSAAEVRDIVFRLDGLHSAAHIKAAMPKPGPRCGVRWSWQGGSSKHFEICTEPIKPAADRLHELVSYYKAEEESAMRSADQLREDSGLTARKYPEDYEAGAYRDAAEKLEALLMEGGL